MTPRVLLTLALLSLPIAATAQCNLAENFDGGFFQDWVVTDPALAFVQDDVFRVAFASPNSNEYHGAVLDTNKIMLTLLNAIATRRSARRSRSVTTACSSATT